MYRLYALPLDDGTIQAAQTAPFARVTMNAAGGRVLVYTDEVPRYGDLVSEAEYKKLPQEDRLWLAECMRDAESERSVPEFDPAMLDALEAALRKERERYMKGARNGAD